MVLYRIKLLQIKNISKQTETRIDNNLYFYYILKYIENLCEFPKRYCLNKNNFVDEVYLTALKEILKQNQSKLLYV